mmetsp:Transcript_78689/g.157359  ORF Transcript_78689/g.157359 Transcript_78689/m.157359 type:complete len:351 (-) Transcript_78689:149-1201(-)
MQKVLEVMQLAIALVLLVAVAALEPPPLLRGNGDIPNDGVASNSSLGCSYVSTCTTGGVEGVCVSVSSGCCARGTTTSGLCAGSSDVLCCTSPPCTTPYGTGTCETSCAGTSFSGYCSGPSDMQCCVADAPSPAPPTPSPGASLTGVDVAYAVSSATAACFKSNGIDFIIPRAFRSTGAVDTEACTTLVNAKAAGITMLDVYLFPCPACATSAAAAQVNATVAYLSSTCDSSWSGKIWLDIEGSQYWTGSATANQAWYEALVDACDNASSPGGKGSCGVYSSSSQWTALFGSTTYSHKAGVYDLWYAHYDDNPSFSDFSAFGGWTTPTIKQYQGDTTLCSFGVDINYAEF